MGPHLPRRCAPRFEAEYEICNWFTGTHPQSPYLNNTIAARRVRSGPSLRSSMLTLMCAMRPVRSSVELLKVRPIIVGILANEFGLKLSDEELSTALAHVEQRGTRGAPHPFFA